MTILRLMFYYLLTVNLAAFIAYGIDKLKAQRARRRIPEASLLLLAAAGGSVGAWLGMRVWHHKTLHKKFKYGVPAIFVLQVAAAAAFFLGKSGAFGEF